MDFRSLGNTGVIGLQWGDEGKGKIVDLLTEHFDVVVRYAGGANAGHTVQIGEKKFALHLVPSGILRPGVLCIIGPGVALDPEMILQEIDGLRERGVEVASNLMISTRAHLVMPYHKKQDRLAEGRLGPARQIGTTARGIGPCYADKMSRSSAFRVCDLYDASRFRARLADVVTDRNALFAAAFGDKEPLDAAAIAEECSACAARLAPHLADTTLLLRDSLSAGRRILFEGAQGSLLDIDHGTFPFVTSSSCVAGGICTGAGVPPSALRSVVGVIKAYTTRVGSGPFPTELHDEIGETIRRRGHEYGTTTGRPRRCGWFDAAAARYAIHLSGVTQIALMHLDTLATLPELRICTAYRRAGCELPFFPAGANALGEVEPIYETMPGWSQHSAAARSVDELPAGARRYIERLEELLGVPITLVSIGADRQATLHREASPKSSQPESPRPCPKSPRPWSGAAPEQRSSAPLGGESTLRPKRGALQPLDPQVEVGVPRERMPRHVAIIMDGNGRWAKSRGLPRIKGHEAGAANVREIVTHSARLGLDCLTLYSFSTENWNRPLDEINHLMQLYVEYLIKERSEIMDNDVRLVQIGRRAGLPEAVLYELDQTASASKDNRGMTLCLALNYSSRVELTDAVRAIGRRVAAGELSPDAVAEETISNSLYTAGLPDPDLLIRTAGEMRVSNFLLWQISYAELYVTETLWPDFHRQDLVAALAAYAHRERRFGRL
jgi:adenylosuccinate synthase